VKNDPGKTLAILMAATVIFSYICPPLAWWTGGGVALLLAGSALQPAPQSRPR
jgi:hypothetical protein